MDIKANHATTKDNTSYLLEVISCHIEFEPKLHAATMTNGKSRGIERKDKIYTEVLADLHLDNTVDFQCSIGHTGNYMNHWINVVPNMSNNTVLG
eukprot:4529372-Ditylum_brightwellii.AAC.1